MAVIPFFPFLFPGADLRSLTSKVWREQVSQVGAFDKGANRSTETKIGVGVNKGFKVLPNEKPKEGLQLHSQCAHAHGECHANLFSHLHVERHYCLPCQAYKDQVEGSCVGCPMLVSNM